MHPALQSLKLCYVTTANLLPVLADYTNPHDLISRLVKKKELIRIKRGFFLIQESISSALIPYPQIANLLYGPSYLSHEWALSFYGMIPEGVFTLTSVTLCPKASFRTPIATFDYFRLSHLRYVIGVNIKESSGGNFLIATPEKALADLIHLKSKHLSSRELLADLVEARRIEEGDLKNLDKPLMREIAENYRSAAVHQLVNVLGIVT